MTREQNIETIRKACVEVNPEIMGLNFGSHFTVKKNSDFEDLGVEEGTYIALFDFEFDSQHFKKALTVNTALKIHILDGKTTDYEVVKVVTFGQFKKLQDNGNIQVIGRPIRLADVLNALNRDGKFERRSGGLVLVWFYRSRNSSFVWNLRTDSLTEQSDECVEFLANLLRV